jgi:hypothetical protein
LRAREITGAAITIIGIILLAYGFIAGGLHGHIGSYITPSFNNKTGQIEVKQGSTWASDSISLVLGWFMVIIGPALWFGEVPTAIKAKLGR